MKTKNLLYNWALSVSALLIYGGCADEFTAEKTVSSDGLTLEVNVSGTTAMSVETRGSSNSQLREDYVKTVDVFFVQNSNVVHYVKTNVVNGKATIANGQWKEQYSGVYDVYVLANKNDYDNPLTPETFETDLSWVQNKTQLLALTDTDINVVKAQYEKYANSEYQDKTFLMDGHTSWNSDNAEANAVINVDLAHAAAKLTVNLGYANGFLTEEIEIFSVSKKLVNYVQDVKSFTEGGSLALTNVQGESTTDGFSLANSTNGDGISRKDILYAYSYPNEWGKDIAGRETYFLVNIPYVENEIVYQNYYKVPVRVSGNTDDLKLERNMEYTINVTVDRKGNESIDEPTELTPTFSIADWESKEVNVDGDTPNYLVVSEKEIEMHDVEDKIITFFSSSPIKVEVVEAYFVNKDGDEISVKNQNLVNTEYNDKTLTGEIKIHSVKPGNVTARYITLRVTNTDLPISLSQDIKIIQYPLEYISGVPGVYATRTDLELTGNTYENFVNNVKLDNKPKIESGPFNSKVYTTVENFWGNLTGIYYVSTEQESNKYILKAASSDFDYDHSNNRMYLVQITSTGEEHTVARPAMDGNGEDIVTKSNDDNNRLVSPMFMLASQLGTVSTANWNTAQEHCKQYVEVAQLDGETKRFADWRLPTYAELQVIARYQNKQPDVMDEVLAGSSYWSAYNNRYLKTSDPEAVNPYEGGSKTKCYIRCIRDVTPEDLEEFRANGIK